MTDQQQFSNLLTILGALARDVARLADATELLAHASAPEAPDYTRPIAEFAGFDWASINAAVVESDDYGPTHLDWMGYTWTRRSPQNKFGEAIWFSRPIGKDGDGKTKYARLISFKKSSEAEPLPRRVVEAVNTNPVIAAPAARPALPAAPAQAEPPAPAAKVPMPRSGKVSQKWDDFCHDAYNVWPDVYPDTASVKAALAAQGATRWIAADAADLWRKLADHAAKSQAEAVPF